MTTEPIRKKKQVRKLAGYWLKKCNFRNYALIVVGIYTALRIGDLLRILWSDVFDFENGVFRTHITLTEQKTGKQKTIALNKDVIAALGMLLPYKRGSYVFASNRKEDKAISRVQAWRIIKEAVNAIKLVGCYGCHSLRKTFGYLAYKAGVSSALLTDLFNHSNFEITKRYLGIDQDERDAVYLGLKIL